MGSENQRDKVYELQDKFKNLVRHHFKITRYIMTLYIRQNSSFLFDDVLVFKFYINIYLSFNVSAFNIFTFSNISGFDIQPLSIPYSTFVYSTFNFYLLDIRLFFHWTFNIFYPTAIHVCNC